MNDPAQRRTRVLVIEDNPANMELARYILTRFGYDVDAAVDGESGVAQVEALAPDIVICDLQLPGIDGFEVLRRLKALPAMRAVPVLAVTAFAMVGDRERVLAAGFDGYIAKPIDPQSFVQQVTAMLGRATPASPAVAAVNASGGFHADFEDSSGMQTQALVLDDSPTNLHMMRSLLEPHGIGVLSASNVREALDKLRVVVPDLIVSDVHLGHEFGTDFYQQVKRRPELQAVPFIFITATVPREMLNLPEGADRVIVRPIDNEMLLQEIRAVMRDRKDH